VCVCKGGVTGAAAFPESGAVPAHNRHRTQVGAGAKHSIIVVAVAVNAAVHAAASTGGKRGLSSAGGAAGTRLAMNILCR
jgi:hypothetical protein